MRRSTQSVLPSQQQGFRHTQHKELHCHVEQGWECVQLIVCRLLPDGFLHYTHPLLAAGGVGSHDAQECCNWLHAISSSHIEPALMVLQTKGCTVLSAVPGADQQRKLVCTQGRAVVCPCALVYLNLQGLPQSCLGAPASAGLCIIHPLCMQNLRSKTTGAV